MNVKKQARLRRARKTRAKISQLAEAAREGGLKF